MKSIALVALALAGVSLVALALAGVSHAEEPAKQAVACISDYALNDNKGCQAVIAYAVCVANAKSDGQYLLVHRV